MIIIIITNIIYYQKYIYRAYLSHQSLYSPTLQIDAVIMRLPNL